MSGLVGSHVIIVCISLIVSLLCHWLIKHFSLATVVAGVVAGQLYALLYIMNYGIIGKISFYMSMIPDILVSGISAYTFRSDR